MTRWSGHIPGMTANQATLGAESGLRMRSAEVAFARLYRSYYDKVFTYCLRRTNRAAAEDAVAEVFAVAWRRLAEIPRGEKELAWLYSVAYRVIGTEWRTTKRRHRLMAKVAGLRADTLPDPAMQVVQRERDQHLLRAAARLSHTDQEILRLAGWEGLPHGDIAEILDISSAAVDQRFARAKKRLAREYDRITGAEPEGGGP